MREMKDSGVEWIGEIPKDWDAGSFGNIILQNDGGIWGADPNGFSDSIVLRSTEQTIDGCWSIDEPAKRDLGDIKTREYYMCRRDDLLITKSSGSDLHIGKTTIVDEQVESLNCYFSNFIQRVRLQSLYSARYYWYVLNSDIARSQFSYLSNSTSGLGNINSTTIKKMFVPFPSDLSQHRIADYLDAKCAQIDRAIARQQEVIEKLKEYKLSVITEAVTKGLNPDVPMKDSGIEWIGEIPEEWEIKKLQAHTTMLTPMRDKPEDLDGEIPWIRIEDYSGKYISVSREQLGVSLETIKAMNLKVYPVGTILCTSSCDLGKCAIVERELVSNQRFIGIIPDENTSSDFLYYLMLSNATRLNHLSSGTIQANLSRVAFEHLMVQFPCLIEQREIADHLDKLCSIIDESIDQTGNLVSKLTEYKKSLIYEVVTGKREV